MPDQLYRRAKAAAALRGANLKTLVTEAVEAHLRTPIGSQRPGKRVKFPLVRSKRPGSLRITPEMIDEALWD